MVIFLEGTFHLFFYVVVEGLEGGGRDSAEEVLC